MVFSVGIPINLPSGKGDDPMTNAKKLAARYLTAGGQEFYTYGPGANADAAFRSAVQSARHESGHGGGSGTIAEKGSFKLRADPMTRDEAEDFANQDINNNDKWGPAFAIPIVADAKAAPGKPLTGFAFAVTQADAEASFKADFAAKFPNRLLRIHSSTRIKDGNLPEIEDVPFNAPVEYQVQGAGALDHIQTPLFASKKEALTHLKKMLLEHRWPVRPGTYYELRTVRRLKVFKIKAVASKLPKWEITGTATERVKASGPVIGYLFYGVASS
jgi:hypothetical protein